MNDSLEIWGIDIGYLRDQTIDFINFNIWLIGLFCLLIVTMLIGKPILLKLYKEILGHSINNPLKRIIRIMDYLLLAVDPQNRVIYANDNLLRLCKYSKNDLMGRDVACILLDVRNGSRKSRLISKNGINVDCLYSVSDIVVDGTIFGQVIVLTDLTEHMKRKQNISALSDKLKMEKEFLIDRISNAKKFQRLVCDREEKYQQLLKELESIKNK